MMALRRLARRASLPPQCATALAPPLQHLSARETTIAGSRDQAIRGSGDPGTGGSGNRGSGEQGIGGSGDWATGYLGIRGLVIGAIQITEN